MTPLTLSAFDSTAPVVTVIIPSHSTPRHRESWVIEAIASVCEQTYGNIELIVIDDGSTDDTRTRIAAFRRNITDRFLYAEQENRGVIRTMNRALAETHGQYVTILACDDLLCPQKIAVQVDLLESMPHVDSVFCPQFEIDEDGEIIGRRGVLPEPFVRSIGSGHTDPDETPDKWDVAELILGAVAHPFAPQSALTRRRVFDALGGFDEQTELDDIDFNLRAALAEFVPRYHPDFLHKVRLHGAQNSRRAWWLCRETVAAVDRFFETPGVPQRLRPYQRYLRALQIQILAGNLRQSGEHAQALWQYMRLAAAYPDRFLSAGWRFATRTFGSSARQEVD